MPFQTQTFKTDRYVMVSLFGHEFSEPEECVTCETCCPGSCTGCTQCVSCNLSYAHGEKNKTHWDNKSFA